MGARGSVTVRPVPVVFGAQAGIDCSSFIILDGLGYGF